MSALQPINLRTLDLNLLKVFDVVMVERSVTRSAQRLHMTQPAVSNALRRLREATNDELFVPGASGMAPTPHAQQLWPVVREALEQLHLAFEPSAFNPQLEARSFTLAMADATAALFVPQLVALLQQTQARVDLRIVPLTTRDPRPLLEQGQADVAVGFFPGVRTDLAAAGDTALLQHDALYVCPYVAVMRRGHPLAPPGALTLDAYCAAQHLRVSFAGRAHGFVDEALAGMGRQRRVMMTVNQFFAAACGVRQSDLITVLPRNFVPATGFAEQLECCELPFDMPLIEVGLLWHRRHAADPAQAWLRQTTVQAAQLVCAHRDWLDGPGSAAA